MAELWVWHNFNDLFLISLATGIQKVLKASWNLQVHLRITPLIQAEHHS